MAGRQTSLPTSATATKSCQETKWAPYLSHSNQELPRAYAGGAEAALGPRAESLGGEGGSWVLLGHPQLLSSTGAPSRCSRWGRTEGGFPPKVESGSCCTSPHAAARCWLWLIVQDDWNCWTPRCHLTVGIHITTMAFFMFHHRSCSLLGLFFSLVGFSSHCHPLIKYWVITAAFVSSAITWGGDSDFPTFSLSRLNSTFNFWVTFRKKNSA